MKGSSLFVFVFCLYAAFVFEVSAMCRMLGVCLQCVGGGRKEGDVFCKEKSVCFH